MESFLVISKNNKWIKLLDLEKRQLTNAVMYEISLMISWKWVGWGVISICT